MLCSLQISWYKSNIEGNCFAAVLSVTLHSYSFTIFTDVHNFTNMPRFLMKNTMHWNLHLIPKLNISHQHFLPKQLTRLQNSNHVTSNTQLLDKKSATIKHYLNMQPTPKTNVSPSKNNKRRQKLKTITKRKKAHNFLEWELKSATKKLHNQRQHAKSLSNAVHYW